MAPMTRKQNFEQGSQGLLTPTELKALAKSLLHPQHPEFGNPDADPEDSDPHLNYLYSRGADRWSASGECESMSSWAKPFFPEGSQVVQMAHHKEESWISSHDGKKYTAPIGNHYVIVSPTTEGPHVVDFTHRQYQNTAGLPVVQHINDFMSRSSMKNYVLHQDDLSPGLRRNLGE